MKNLRIHEKIENGKSSVVEPIIARCGWPTVVVIVTQGEILGGAEYVFGKKIGGNEKMG
jgi:hypothetical protein